MSRFLFLLFIICSALCVASCGDSTLPPGIVATVNGEQIALHSLHTLLDCRSASMGITRTPSLEEMQKNYVNALKTLITHALVRQEMKDRNLLAGKETYNQFINRITEDYGRDNLEQYLKDAYIREDDWRALIGDFLAIETFRNQVLLPGIRIGKNEIKEYYNEHKADFNIPERLQICFLNATSENLVKDWCKKFSQQIRDMDEWVQCVEMPVKNLDEDWKTEILSLSPYQCAKARNVNGTWQTVAVVGKVGQTRLDIGSAYALIEKILLQQKQETAFRNWLAEKIKKSRIMVAPELNHCLAKYADNENE